tara:strand:+ start:46 stop:1155 length:1110 start_codon:yes stop_codon:yes gene_type:complete
MRLRDILKESEDRGLTNEVKKHFLEIVSTYNKYQESMDRKSDIIEVAETLGGITEAARELALREADDWFDKHTIKRNMSELTKLGSQFDKVAKEARNLDQRLTGLYEDMGNILSRYYKIGEITEDEMKQRLGISEAMAFVVMYKKKNNKQSEVAFTSEKDAKKFLKDKGGKGKIVRKNVKGNMKTPSGQPLKFKVLKESKGDCGCGCGGTTPGGCSDRMNEDVDKDKLLSALKDKLSDEGGAAGFKDLQDKAKEMGVDLTSDMLKGMDGISQHRDGDYILDGFASDAQRRAAFASGYKAKGKKGKKKNELKEFGEKFTKLMEKNVPTNPSKWAYYKAQAKKKFDVYPSAYANGWAAKKYKAAGGGWKKG